MAKPAAKSAAKSSPRTAAKKSSSDKSAPKKSLSRKPPAKEAVARKAAKRARPAASAPPAASDDVLKFDCEEGATDLPVGVPRSVRGFAATSAATSWRMANALETLRSQINVLAPHRSKVSDGGIGDPAHQARGSASDHNPWVRDGSAGVVTARDITHDKAKGCDCNVLAESLRAARDPRLKYVIWNSRIFSAQPQGGTAAWEWRTYTGSNKHNKHLHISVKSSKVQYDDAALWEINVA